MKSVRRGRPPHPDVLTPAEWRVVEGIRRRRTNAEIAEELGVSVNTVRYHVSNIFTKLAFTSRRELEQWGGRPRRRREWALAFAALGWRGAAVGVAGVAFGAVVVATFAMLFGHPDDESLAAATEDVPRDPPAVIFVDLSDERGHLLRFAEPIDPVRGAALAGLAPLDLGRSAITSTSPDGRFLAVTAREPGPAWPESRGARRHVLRARTCAPSTGSSTWLRRAAQ